VHVVVLLQAPGTWIPKNEKEVLALLNPVPVRVTTVPVVPELGLMPVMEGKTSKVNWPDSATVTPFEVTLTGNDPAACGGLSRVQTVPLLVQETSVVAAPPKLLSSR